MKKKSSLCLFFLLLTWQYMFSQPCENSAINFNGTNWVEVLDHPSLSPCPTCPFTVEFWVNAVNAFSGEHFIGKRPDACGGPDFYQLVNSPVPYLWFGGPSGGVTSSHTLPALEWHHLAIAFDGAQFRFYFDGILSGTGSGIISGGTGTNLLFGISGSNGSCPGLVGKIDNVLIWNVARTMAQIQADMSGCITGSEPGLAGAWNFDEGSGSIAYDLSPNHNDGFLINNPNWVNSTAPWCGPSDNIPPIITCPANVSEAACTMTLPNVTGSAIASDNCPNPLKSWSDEEVADICPGIGTGIFRTWLAEDEAGNSAVCIQEIGVRCQASQISFSDVTSNSIYLEWINGNGDHRIVKINTTDVFDDPVNGINYIADSDYSPPGEQVIYNGNSDHVTVTNLSPNTGYYFKVFEAYCEGLTPFYYLPDATGNPKNEFTLEQVNSADNIPFTIPSPIKCAGNPGLFQSKLPNDLFSAPLQGFNCVQKRCNEIEWRSNGVAWNSNLNYPQMTSACEVLPKAYDCFAVETIDVSIKRDPLTLEFRQRGYLTGKRVGNDCESPCYCFKCNGIDPCTPGHVSHGTMGCNARDDRRSWDINYIPGWHEMNVPVYAVDDGVVDYLDASSDINIRIRHGGARPWYSWCVYARPHADLHIGDSVRKGELVGIVFDPDGKDPQMHFGVFYYDTDLERFVSVDRPILRNPPGRSLSMEEASFTDLEIKFFGEPAAGSKLSRKMDSIWVDMGVTTISGRLNATLVPGLQDGDSLAVIAGSQVIKFKHHDELNDNNSINIHLFDNPGNNKVAGAGFEPLLRKEYYDVPGIDLRISGTQYYRFDILHFNESDEEFGSSVLSIGHLPSDTIVNITLPVLGDNIIGVRFIGLDTVIMYRRFIFYPSGDDLFHFNLIAEPEYFGSAVFIDGQFHDQLGAESQVYQFPPGGYWINITKPGYIDTTYYVSKDTSIQLLLRPAASSMYVKGNSVVYDFGKYKRLVDQNVSLVDSAGGSRIGVDQYYDALTDYGVSPASRVIEFNKLHWPAGNSLSAGIVLDQREAVSGQQVYLLDLFDGGIVEKRFFTGNEGLLTYDSASQLIIYKRMSFRDGQFAKERIVLTRKQPAAILISDLGTIAEHVTGAVSLHDIIGDPDSLVNDLTMEFISNDNVSVWISGDSLFFRSSNCFVGRGSFILQVTHDEIVTADTIWVEIVSQPDPTIEVVGSTSFCEGESVELIASTGTSYLWSNDQTTQTIQVHESGNYYVIVADDEGCVDTSSIVSVEVLENPEPVLEPSGDLQICSGDSIEVSVAGDYESYLWSNGSVGQSVFFNSEGLYNVSVVDSNGCIGQSDLVNLEVLGLPIVNLGPDTIITSGSITLDAGNTGSDFLWSTSAVDQIINVSMSGVYSVTVTDIHGCQGVDSISVQFVTGTSIAEGEDRFVLYPNPNTGTFIISGSTSSVQSFTLEVYTVQGTMVHKEDFRNLSGSFTRTITLADEAKGVHVIKLSSGLRSYTIRMVVN